MRRREQIASWLSTLPGVLALGVFPLAGAVSYSHITHDKWIAALILGAVCAALGLAAALLRRPVLSPGLIAGLAFFGWTALSALLGSEHDLLNADGVPVVWIGAGRYEGLATFLAYAAVFLACAAGTPKRLPVQAAAAVGLAGFAAVVFLQYAEENPLGLFPPGHSTRTSYEFQGTIGNIDMVCAYLCLVTPLLLTPYLFDGRGAARAVFACCGLTGAMLLLIDVQAGLLALAALGLALVWLCLTRPELR